MVCGVYLEKNTPYWSWCNQPKIHSTHWKKLCVKGRECTILAQVIHQHPSGNVCDWRLFAERITGIIKRKVENARFEVCFRVRRRERYPQGHHRLHSSQKPWVMVQALGGRWLWNQNNSRATPRKICSDKLFVLNISRFINQSDPWSLIETRYQKAQFQLQSWQKSYLGSWPRYSVTSCFEQVWLLVMS